MAIMEYEKQAVTFIGAKAQAGEPVGAGMKSLLIAIAKRERIPVPLAAIRNAEKQGFDISGLLHKL